VADADDGSLVVDEDVSLHLIRDCSSSSGLDGTLLESSLSASNPFSLRVLDDIIINQFEIECRERLRTQLRLLKAVTIKCSSM
jgi:hypothetical protein